MVKNESSEFKDLQGCYIEKHETVTFFICDIEEHEAVTPFICYNEKHMEIGCHESPLNTENLVEGKSVVVGVNVDTK